MKHDYEAAIEIVANVFDDAISRLVVGGDYEQKARDAAIYALRLAAKVTGDTSGGMHNIGITISERDGYRINEWACPSEIFKAMIAQAEKEIEPIVRENEVFE